MDHYVYCRSSVCPGCLPTDEELQGWHRLALWGEMLARCIAQTPQTETTEGALAAIRANNATYREHAQRKRAEPGWATSDGEPGRVMVLS
jgi:hypothetical protein